MSLSHKDGDQDWSMVNVAYNVLPGAAVPVVWYTYEVGVYTLHNKIYRYCFVNNTRRENASTAAEY